MKKTVAISSILAALLLSGSVNCHAQSTADTAEAIQRDLDSIKAEFDANLQSVISNPENLLSGQAKIGCEQILFKLDQLESRIQETIDLLAKRESDLAAKADFTEAERQDFSQALRSQKQEIEDAKHFTRYLQMELKDLVDREIDEIQKVYDFARGISGQDQAQAKLETRIKAILNRDPPANPPAPVVFASPEVWLAFSDILREFEEVLYKKVLDTNILLKLQEIRSALEKSQDIQQTPHLRVQMLVILSNIRRIFDECGVVLKQKANLSRYKKGLLDSDQSFEERYARLLLNSERSVQTKFETGALNLRRLRENWESITIKEKEFTFSRHDPLALLLLKKSNNENPEKTSNDNLE